MDCDIDSVEARECGERSEGETVEAEDDSSAGASLSPNEANGDTLPASKGGDDGEKEKLR